MLVYPESNQMKQFVFQDLKENKKFLKLFKNIDIIIGKSSDTLSLNTVSGIFIDVSSEITKLNDDLNQVSHRITLLLSGYIHLYAVYLTWKKFS